MTSNELKPIWQSMLQRCRDKNCPAYPNYGGRGIGVDPSWSNVERRNMNTPSPGYLQFVSDMGPRPKGYTLERKDNDADYGPTNCYWASRSRQSRNRRTYGAVKFKWVNRRSGSGNYQARWRHPETKQLHHCGTFRTPQEAHLAACAHRLENYWRI